MAFLKSLIVACLMVLSFSEAKAAPFYPSFHNIDANVLFSNFSFYPSQGLGLQTLSVYPGNGVELAAGSFDNQVQGAWYARANMNTAQFVQYFNQYGAQGFRPRELSVMSGPGGQPEFGTIWKKLAGESYYTYINMTNADFTAKWQNLVVGQGYRVEDYIAYTVNGQRMAGAIFVKDGQPFYLYIGQTQAQMVQHFNQLSAQGFFPTSFNAAVTPQGLTYSAVWMKKPCQTAMYFNMTAADYQAKFNQFGAQGFRLTKVQGYAAGTRFAAIWTK